jgi:signal transduction histidine kinase/CheY-like chemotaxis protein
MGRSKGAWLAFDLTRSQANESPGQAAIRHRLLQSQLDGIYAHMAKASVISTLAALALVVYLTPVFGTTATHGWFAAKATIAICRFILAQLYRAEKFRARAKLANGLMLASLALDGAVWGLAGTWGSGASSGVVSLLVAFLASVAMLATFGLQLRLKATAAYVVPMLVPLTIALCMRWDALGLLASVGTTLVLVQTMVTGYASENRLSREFMLLDQSEKALQDRSAALQTASKATAELEEALDQVKRQSAVKTLFLGMMSHELRTPLHGILGMAELLQQDVSNPIAKHRLELIQSSGHHLLELIAALLDVSRIDTGRLELHPKPFDLSAEVRDLADLYEVRCQTKGIGFRPVLKLPRPFWVVGDAARIRQVLHNLLGNAVKFTERGLVRLTARQHGGAFVFEIADTGPGIASKEMAHIFEAFAQADETAARPADGTGLGLTIARELARAMGGDVSVSSTLGVGSQFTFTAVLDSVPAGQIPEARDPEVRSTVRLRDGYRVLVVEDNEVNALIANAHLTQLGAFSIRAHDGREGVEAAFYDPRPDLVLMDCRMPVMGGPAATREIRRIERASGLVSVPIIALTASPTDEEKDECFEAGMNGFLQKPFSADDLLREIGSALSAVSVDRMRDHPLYEFAKSLDDLEPDLFGSATVH